MKHLELTFPTPRHNLACDEALLDWREESRDEQSPDAGILRFWESSRHFVALGYTGEASREADLAACRARGIPVLRRCSGGGTVLQGPGCLNYALILPIEPNGPWSDLSRTNRFVMRRHRDALQTLLSTPLEVEGFTDLAAGGLKFSGNAQRRRRRHLLFHGTFLLDFDLSLVEAVLPPPPRQPAYRHRRAHADFLTNLNLSREAVQHTLQRAWDADEPLAEAEIPCGRIEALAAGKYSSDEWNFKF